MFSRFDTIPVCDRRTDVQPIAKTCFSIADACKKINNVYDLHVECGMQFVQDGVFKAELNEFFTRELAEDGYSGVEVRVTPTRTEIIILATRTQNVLGEKGRRIRELTSVVQKRFSFPEGTVELYAEKVGTRGLSAIAQAESLRYKLIGGLAVRRYIMLPAYVHFSFLPAVMSLFNPYCAMLPSGNI